MLIAGDIGGTKTDLAIYSSESGAHSPFVQRLSRFSPARPGISLLKVLATGGIYLAGAVALHTLRVLQEPGFMRAFTNKGRFSELMCRIPVHVIMTRAALMGAATYGLENLKDRRE